MKVIRTEGDYELNEGSLMANGLFNVTDQANDPSSIGTARMRVSDWFDTEEKERLEGLPPNEFKEECEKFLST